ncbi:MAG: hypothetical protein ACXW5U_06815 [Thermoanaerobaculia bacterium]
MRNRRMQFVFTYVLLIALAAPAIADDLLGPGQNRQDHLSTLITTEAVPAPRDPRRERQVRVPETYKPVVALAVTYGDGPGQLGFMAGGSDQRALGPLSFAVDVEGDSIAILDPVNQRVVTFNRYGLPRGTIDDARGTDLALMPDGIGVLDTATATLVVHSPNGTRTEVEVSPEQSKLIVDAATGAVYFRERRDGTTTLDAAVRAPAAEVFRVDDHAGEIRTEDGFTIPVHTAETFGSIDLVGIDRGGNIFVEVEQLLPDSDVIKEVRKYRPSGELRAVIPIAIDYAAHPRRELVLDGAGNLYHLRPLAHGVVVERWEQQP